jgi:hypothetical protein
MTPAMPELGWAGTLGVLLFSTVCITGIVVYHLWLDRRLRRERSGTRPQPRR